MSRVFAEVAILLVGFYIFLATRPGIIAVVAFLAAENSVHRGSCLMLHPLGDVPVGVHYEAWRGMA